MQHQLLKYYRSLPVFKGKLRLGKLLFKSLLESCEPLHFKAHYGLEYHIPNTVENLGIELLINGVYEEEIVDFLKEHIQNGFTYFDIGANIGSLALPIISSKKGLKYVGFEASPTVFEYLQRNMEVNGIQNATLINKLVHRNGEQSMKFYHSKWYGKSSLAPVYSNEYLMVDSVSIDEYCSEENIKKVDWMKIDVQGFELYVFEGMKEMLQQKKIKNVLFEYEAWAEESAGLKAGTAAAFIQSQGYELFSLNGKPWQFAAPQKDTMIWARPGR